ncbi:hypothetical protein ZWY2020_006376 [Hordeum vulgare]|nr:hypothetical protein ZWY2020_014043 [Hordeum vulgare]KAI5016525.1 hypothetical protein ZWY2020_006376 [Hordeum vulgare]
MSGWTSIPADLLAEISGRLEGDADRIHIHQKLYTTSASMGQTLFFWRPGDAAWTMQLGRPNGRIDSAAFHQGKFYVTDIGWGLHVYDLVFDRFPPKVVGRTNLYCSLRARHGFRQFPGGGRPTWYLVAFNGELLLVVTYRAPNIKAVEVLRPDWAAERLELQDKSTIQSSIKIGLLC